MTQRIVAQLPPEQFAALLGEGVQPPARTPSRVVLDAGTVEAGDAFVASHDDAALTLALSRGAALLIAPHGVDPCGAPCVHVDDADAAVRSIIRGLLDHQRAQERFTAFGVLGINGKTTCARMLDGALSSRLGVLRVEDLSSAEGLQALLDLDARHNIGVFEIPIAPKGRAVELIEWLRPEARVVTALAPAHLDLYSSLGGLAQEVMRALEVPGCQRVVIERDLLHLQPNLEEGCQVKTIGTDFDCSILIHSARHMPGIMMATYRMPNDSRLQLRVPTEGLHNAYNFALVLAATLELGLMPPDIARGLEGFEPIKDLVHGALTCGARLMHAPGGHNIGSARATLARFKDLSQPEGRIIVLGELPGLNMARDVLHRRLGGIAASLQPRLLICIGDRGAEMISEGAMRAGLPGGRIRVESRSRAHVLATAILHRVEPSDALLLKGLGADALIEPLGATLEA